MTFEWDFYKAWANVIKHGISFEQAIAVFDDPRQLQSDDVAHSTITEPRLKVIGQISQNESEAAVIVVIYVEIEKENIRVVSARPASRRERVLYGTRY